MSLAGCGFLKKIFLLLFFIEKKRRFLHKKSLFYLNFDFKKLSYSNWHNARAFTL